MQIEGLKAPEILKPMPQERRFSLRRSRFIEENLPAIETEE